MNFDGLRCCFMMMIEQQTKLQQPRTGTWLLLIVAGFVAIQILNRQPERLKPGPERGDLVLQKHDLPDEILGWNCLRFQPALPSDELPDGQFWWTHSWSYRKQQLEALVAFDQADWKSWHELTMCYQAIGWKLADRKVIRISDTVAVVLASLEKPTQEKATLLFALFDQDGSLIPPPRMELQTAPEEEKDQSFSSMLNGRLTYELPEGAEQSSTAETFGRVLQVQVFVPHGEPLSDDEVNHLVELHLETLGHFRNAWLNQRTFN